MKNSPDIKCECKRVASLLRHFLLDIHTIQTTFEGMPLDILVADDGTTLSYVREIISDDEAIVSRKSKVNALKAPQLIRSDADIVIVGANKLLADRYEACGFGIVPKWVKLRLPVTEEPYSRLYDQGRQTRKYFKWMIKKSTDAGFECEISTDRDRFDMFYHEMYRPYALHRYGERAVVYKHNLVQKAFSRGAVAFVQKDGQVVAGTVLYRQGNVLYLPHTGVAMDQRDVMKEGAAFALDYYLAQYAHSKGCSHVDFGHSRPFLSDGTLKYKLNWHMDVLPDDDCMGVFAFATPNQTDQAVRFLSANPHFHLTREGCRMSDE